MGMTQIGSCDFNVPTPRQETLMLHAISGPDRNWFGTGFGCQDSEDFELLVAHGYATKERPSSWMGDDVIYRVTSKGKRFLDREK